MRLARIFTDNAVFRANAPLRLFGQGKGEISITLCGNTYKQTVTEENWIAEFPAQPYGGLYNMKIELCGDGRGAKNETIVLKNVAFGEVLLCAGQSNMQFELREEINADTARENPKIRYYFSDNPERNCHLNSSFGWLNAAAENLPYFSALGYHTAEEIVRQKGVYVGLIACFQGASAIRSWLSPEVLTPEVFVPVELRHSDSREPL